MTTGHNLELEYLVSNHILDKENLLRLIVTYIFEINRGVDLSASQLQKSS